MPVKGTIHTLLPKVAFEKSKLLSRSQYKELISSRDIKEFVLKLRKIKYFKIEEEKKLTPILIEFQLKEVLFLVFEKIIREAPKKFQEFFLCYILKYEMENIKALVRRFRKEITQNEIPIHYTVETILRRNKLLQEALRTSNIASLMEVLKKLPYGNLFKEINKLIQREKSSFFYFDLALDLRYLEELWVTHLRLGRKDRSIVREYIGFKNDFYNVETILRAKNLNLQEQVINRMLSRYYYHLTQQSVEKLIKGKVSSEQLLQLFKIKNIPDPKIPDLKSIRYLYKQRVLQFIRSLYYKAGFNIGKPFAILLNKELEVENLRMISLGVHYQRNPDEILEKLHIL
ncbi:MAG: V-type ATPase subunit [Candidatus Helarchaeota archaeon]